jgi:hypothetical protein
MAEPVSTRAVLAGTWLRVLFDDKGRLQFGRVTARSSSAPGRITTMTGKVAAAAADVTQVQGVGVA